MNKKISFLMLFFTIFSGILFAQKKTVTGKVTDEDGLGLPGVSVLVKGTSRGISTDFDGKYQIEANTGEVLVYSSVGYSSQEKKLSGGGKTLVINVVLKEQTQQLGEVVVTALGIKREEKALSYNVQQVNSEELTKVKDANFINALNGKVAGVTINRSSSGIGGASKVIMRGQKSIEKSNNALYVVDGVPMLSLTRSQGEGKYNSDGSTESIADINPEDIESMTVLTGASAAALYGSAAANGAILITTKKGKEGKLSVVFSSGTEIGSPFILPEFQNTYGSDGDVTSWGKKLPNDAEKYNVRDFFQTSYTLTNSLSISGGSEKNQTYFSAASTNGRGIVPNNNYNRYNFSIRNTSHLLNDRLKIDVSASYIIQNHLNMINQGEYLNPLVGAYLLPRGYGLSKAKHFERYNPNKRIYEQVWGDLAEGPDGTFSGSFSKDYSLQNPYWAAYRNLREMKRERNIMSLGVTYDLKKWSDTEKWDISGRVRSDNTNFTDTDKRYASTMSTLKMSPTGYFRLGRGVERQTYMDVLTNITKYFKWDNVGRFSLTTNIGASLQDIRYDDSYFGGGLIPSGIPNVFNYYQIEPAGKETHGSQTGYIEQTQSVFGSIEAGYNSWLYLTLTGRNDWASQLANSPQKSFFYPSVGLSTVITDMISSETKEKWSPTLSFMKVRLAFSSVGSPFQRGLTSPTYNFNTQKKIWEPVSHFPIGQLYPERTDSYEVGLATKWLKGKLTFDATIYQTNTYNQTISVESSSTSGYTSSYAQTGDVRNRGYEIGLGYNANLSEKIGWNSYFTISYNQNRIMKLIENEIDPTTGKKYKSDYLEKSRHGGFTYLLRTGGTLGDVYTKNDFRRDSNGNIMVDANGNVNIDDFKDVSEYKKLGSVLPDYNLGWRNDFSIGNFNIGAMLTGRIGGVVVSMTQGALDNFGVSKASADARDAGGVYNNGVKINPQNYYTTLGKALAPQYYTYSATNFRLQEAYISYKLPRKFINNQMDLTFSVIGRNLLMIYAKAPFDPEAVSSTGNYSQGLDYFMMPSLRSFGINIKANF